MAQPIYQDIAGWMNLFNQFKHRKDAEALRQAQQAASLQSIPQLGRQPGLANALTEAEIGQKQVATDVQQVANDRLLAGKPFWSQMAQNEARQGMASTLIQEGQATAQPWQMEQQRQLGTEQVRRAADVNAQTTLDRSAQANLERFLTSTYGGAPTEGAAQLGLTKSGQEQVGKHNEASLAQNWKLGQMDLTGKLLSVLNPYDVTPNPNGKGPPTQTPNRMYQQTQQKASGLLDLVEPPPVQPTEASQAAQGVMKFLQDKQKGTTPAYTPIKPTQGGAPLGSTTTPQQGAQLNIPPGLLSHLASFLNPAKQFRKAVANTESYMGLDPNRVNTPGDLLRNFKQSLDETGWGLGGGGGTGIQDRVEPALPLPQNKQRPIGPPMPLQAQAPLSQYVSPEVQNNPQSVEQLIQALLQQLRYA